MNRNRLHRPHRHRGLSIPEILLGLAISALLMSTLAMTVSAMAQSIRANEDYALSVQNARLAMLRMTGSIRQCVQCQVGETPPANGVAQVSDPAVLLFVPRPGQLASFRLRGTDLLYCPSDTGANSTGSVLARDVASLQFAGQIDPADPNKRVLNVQIRLKTTSGSSTSFELVESAAPRRNLVLQ